MLQQRLGRDPRAQQERPGWTHVFTCTLLGKWTSVCACVLVHTRVLIHTCAGAHMCWRVHACWRVHVCAGMCTCAGVHALLERVCAAVHVQCCRIFASASKPVCRSPFHRRRALGQVTEAGGRRSQQGAECLLKGTPPCHPFPQGSRPSPGAKCARVLATATSAFGTESMNLCCCR